MPPTPSLPSLLAWYSNVNRYLKELNKWLHDLRDLLVLIDWKKLKQDYPAGASANVPKPPPDWP